MYISVIYQNDKMGIVDDLRLDELISSKKIKKFLRSEGWVTIGSDAVRKSSGMQFGKSQERRLPGRRVRHQ